MNHDYHVGDLRLFCSVARHSSFISASTELGFSSAYISKRIAALERQFNAKLFDRTTRQVRLSAAGEAILEWAQRIVAASRHMDDAVLDAQTAPAGRISIVTSPRLARRRIGPIMQAYRRLNPGVEVWLETTDQPARELDERYTIDIRIGPPTENHLVAQHLWRGRRILCAAPDYLQRRGIPHTLQALAQHDCLRYRDREQVFGQWRLSGPHGDEVVKLENGMGCNATDIVVDWALAGLGIMLMSDWDIWAELQRGQLQQVLPDYIQDANIWAVCSSTAAHTPRIRSCIAFIKAQLVEGPLSLGPDIA